jgi:tRNA G18 (ribose-2'-O)-methylase SpoU
MLERCDETVRLPMRGFIRSYNQQVAVAVTAVDRLRQLQGSAPAP